MDTMRTLNLVHWYVGGDESADHGAVGGDESTHHGAVHDTSTAVTSKESATSIDLKECEESSGKQLKVKYYVVASHGLYFDYHFCSGS